MINILFYQISLDSDLEADDFHPRNPHVYRNPSGTFNQYANQYMYNKKSLTPKQRLENLQNKNVNLQVANDEIIKKSAGTFRRSNNPISDENENDSASSESQMYGKVYTYPKHLQTKKRNSELDISFKGDSTPVFLQNNNPIPSQDEGEQENIEYPQSQDEYNQDFGNGAPYFNQLSYANPSQNLQIFPFVGCSFRKGASSKPRPACHHFIGYPMPISSYGKLKKLLF